MTANRRLPPPVKLRAINGRLPPHALDAEAAVLSACILKPENIDEVAAILRRPDDWYSEANGLIWPVVYELHLAGRPVDLVTIAGVLRDRGQLSRVGGSAYLAQIVDETPNVSHVAQHAEIVAERAVRRRFIAESQRIYAQGYDEVSPDWLQQSIQALSDVAADRKTRGTINTAWEPLPEEWLFTPPAPRDWLLQHPTRKGTPCAPGQGDGLLPLGRAGLLSSEGGAGKTMMLVQLALAVACNIPWLGHFHVAREAAFGRVLLALAEEKPDEIHRRMWSAAELMGLTNDQRRHAARTIQPLALAGKPVALVAPGPDGRTIEETTELRDLRRRLDAIRFRRCLSCRKVSSLETCECGLELPPVIGWSLVVIDPLARWAGADTESDNSAATRFVQAVESLCEAPGLPTVIVAHHSSKDSRKAGEADSRGVTAITDGFRWASTIHNREGKVIFRQTKSNYSIPMTEGLELVRSDGGVLRVQSDDEVAEAEHLREERAAARQSRQEQAIENRVDAAARAILETLQRHNKAGTPIKTRAELIRLVKGGQGPKNTALSRLLADRRIVREGELFVVPSRSTTSVAPQPDPSPEASQGSLFEASQ